MKELIRQLAARGVPAPQAEALAGLCQQVWFRKGQLLWVPGQVAQHLYFLSRGLARGYRWQETGEVTLWFAQGGNFLVPDGCFSGKPGGEYLEFLEETVAFSLSLQEAERLPPGPLPSSRLYLSLLEEKALLGKQREQMLRLPAAADRYRFVREAFPYLVRQVPLEHLASYLNMSPKHLGRIRRAETRGG